MARKRHHYEQAFEAYLRDRRIPYVSVNEARKALLPETPRLSGDDRLKSFDFVIYGEGSNLLVEIKGRKIARKAGGHATRSSLQNWVTEEDVRSLSTWEGLFGDGFEAALVFVYWCDDEPPSGLFQEVIEHRERWYAVRAITVTDYRRRMRVRSRRWGTVSIPAEAFERLSQPLTPPVRVVSHDPGPDLPMFEPIAG